MIKTTSVRLHVLCCQLSKHLKRVHNAFIICLNYNTEEESDFAVC